ncbi:MAG: sulfatase-like hydrolase/transferase [Magnetospirillum sp.]|jgi:arylsulfatase A-like enzyme|nr:sulfatase-like hydrolase/transferase [Magnetospirillum sp.]
MARKPNILLITSDQQRGDCYGFEGRKVLTPHLDMLAQSGTRFSACITPNVVCQPSRASILTGLLPRTHGVWDNGIDLDTDIGEAGFGGTFARGGWRTGFIGKAHFSTFHTFKPSGRPECRSSSQDYGADWSGPYMGFQHVDMMIAGHNMFLPQKPPQGLQYEAWYHKDGRGDRLDKLFSTKLPPDVGAAQTWNSALPSAFHNSTWIGDRTLDFIQANKDTPWLAWASFPDPHHPFDAPSPWCYMHHPDAVDLPVHRTLDLDRRPWWHRASLEGTPKLADPELQSFRSKQSRTPAQSDLQLRHLIANYYGMISLIDHNVGRILLGLERLGLDRDTLVVYSTDHGDWLGDHGLLLKGPMHYDGLLRVGCIVRGPGVPAGKIVQHPVSTLDFASTFYDYAGLSAGRALHSRSLRPLIEGTASRDFAYNEWDLHPSRCGVALRLRTVRTKTHKLTLELDSGAGEFYDLANDPSEMDNRFSDPAMAAIQRELSDMIRSRPQDVRDPPPQPIGMA